MRLKVNSNGKEIDMPKADFDKFSPDQKRNYTVLSATDEVASKQVTSNTADKKESSKKD